MQNSNKKGFTLLELLIVIGIIAILSVVVILVLNPAETLRKSRDTQRMSDLATLKTAIGLYTTTIASPTLSSTTDSYATPRINWSNTACQSAVGTWATGEDRIFYSYSGAEITDLTLDNVSFTTIYGATQVSNANTSLVDGLGWLPIKFSDIVGGSPISSLPIDPTNDFVTGSVTSVLAGDLFYRYGCSNAGNILNYEIDATLESAEFTTSPNDRRIKDGGNSTLMYEVATNPAILGANHDATPSLGF